MSNEMTEEQKFRVMHYTEIARLIKCFHDLAMKYIK